MITIAMIAEVITEEPDFLVEDGVTRRRFLQAAGSNILGLLTASGLSPTTAKAVAATTTSGTPSRLVASIITGATGRYEVDVADSWKSVKLGYNTLRRLLGASAQIGATNADGEQFHVGSVINIQDLPKLLQSGEIIYENPDEGVYIEVKLPNGEELIIASEDNGEGHVPVPEQLVDPSQLLEVWWNNWEKWGSMGYLDEPMFELLRKNKLDPRRPNIDDGYNDKYIHGEDELEQYEPKEPEKFDVSRDYATASPMHQWSESRFASQLGDVLGLLG